MGNARRAESDVTLEQQTYTINLTFNKVCEIESLLGGKSLLAPDVIGSMGTIRAILYVCLRDKIKGLSMNKVGKLIDETPDFNAVAESIVTVVKGFYGVKDDEDEVKAGEDSGTVTPA